MVQTLLEIDKKDDHANKITKEVSELEGRLAIWQKNKEYFGTSDWIKIFTRKLIQLYRYGFNIGRIRPELVYKIPDLITIIENWRNKNIVHKTNYQLLIINKHADPHQNNPIKSTDTTTNNDNDNKV